MQAESEACEMRVVFVSETEMGLRMIWTDGDRTDDEADFDPKSDFEVLP